MSRILLVADVPWVLNDVRASLSTPAYELIETSEPETAAAVARQQGVDAVVVDLQVGSMGGMAVTHEVRSWFGLAGDQSPPVVMLLDRAADGFLAKRAGADGWLAKPFTSRQLRDTLGRALAGPPASPGPAAKPPPAVDPDTAEAEATADLSAEGEVAAGG